MNNKNLAIGAVIVVLLSGLIMYAMKESETETQAQAQVQEQPTEQAQLAEEMTPPSTETLAEPVAETKPSDFEPETLGASSSGLGR